MTKVFTRVELLFMTSVLLALINVSYLAQEGLKTPETEVYTLEAIPILPEPMEDTRVAIKQPPEPIYDEVPIEDPMFTPEEELMLMKIAMAEAESEEVEGKALVMRVVLNRVASEEFPDNIDEVLHQNRQFSTVKNGTYDASIPDAECYEALELIEQGEYELMTALYFASTWDCWAASHREFAFDFKGHHFWY